MEITLAKTEDIPSILALQTQIYRIKSLPQNAAQVLESLINSDYCDVVVAKEDSEILGSAFLFYLPIPAHGKPLAYLEGVVVDEKKRKKGLGTALTQKTKELARQKGCYKMLFTSGFDRADVHTFYENQGFKKWGYEFRMDLN